MPLLKDLNRHINDDHITFDEIPHIYYVDGEAYKLSVTKFIHNYFPQFNSDKVIDKMMSSVNWEKSEYFGKTKSEIKELWKKNGQIASAEGTKLHKSIENFYNQIYEEKNESKEFEYFLHFHNNFIKDKKIPYRTEWEIYDVDLKLAGSIDILYKDINEDVFDICDWKRCKEIKDSNPFEAAFPPIEHLPNCNKWQYSLQLNTYKYILEKNYKIKIRDMFLVCLHPMKQNYILIKVPDLSDELETIIINERAKKQRIT